MLDHLPMIIMVKHLTIIIVFKRRRLDHLPAITKHGRIFASFVLVKQRPLQRRASRAAAIRRLSCAAPYPSQRIRVAAYYYGQILVKYLTVHRLNIDHSKIGPLSMASSRVVLTRRRLPGGPMRAGRAVGRKASRPRGGEEGERPRCGEEGERPRGGEEGKQAALWGRRRF